MKSSFYFWKLDLPRLTFPNIQSLTQASHLLLLWNKEEVIGTHRGQIITPLYPRMEWIAVQVFPQWIQRENTHINL